MTDSALREEDVDPDPLVQFRRWLDEAREAAGFEAEAVALATADASGAPSLRMVLLKGADEAGFTFFTNYRSRKAEELAANPQAALLFHWKELGRQVRVEGPVERVTRAETEAYVRSRGRDSQLSALASPQSEVVPDRHWLEQRVADLRRDYGQGELPVPDDWGGFRLTPRSYEFWQHRDHRLHDRLRYRPDGDGWALERLAP
ncbi:MAG TPA: pyridoxamine 5'-phosphate oxidase [Thermoleophilaceae bacterium]|jgi:pyridoxamine 5'-phosphate oxidase